VLIVFRTSNGASDNFILVLTRVMTPAILQALLWAV
jgi:hypothetical protein